MGAMSQEGSQLAAGIDLVQFHQVFFEEAGENLEALEQRLLALDPSCADDEALNAIFRCAHSVKGGAATFGFGDVAALTHEMETLLDRLRRHELAPSPAMVDLLLAAGDALRAQLARHQGLAGESPDAEALRASIRALAAGDPAPGPSGRGAPGATAAQAPALG
ncbi:MAG: Hpt domain-containing protein, partial [Burkholderiales bacterium]|nr:Hpt domain-containing protein [Burkholderiales bacterium]